ncbi:hypothetical protein I3842_15G106600 [Carya illinoinensis]|uniref:TIR domain-containing protein n=1 Tax=Carya illinoinensis TaxID=32201 RepID=A0A922D8C1_CARIL|nr:hypothetical protein I3842_15G106600 [Carya illinoinensis]KAG6675508.1 hypothetical protein I3842_15G106600 [Carya illinoinensis]KAG6675509.1 hypothetical protein I3842_15G106600 [Carya illinoinensis]
MTTSFMALQGASSSLRSSSSSVHPWTHDVFLSFRGEDVRQKFISHLYHALYKRGINTYIDDKLERGDEISQALFQAIEGSMISIIILSKNYAESRWCLNELLKIFECMETVKQIVLPVFYDVDPSNVRHQKGSFGEAFAKLKDRFEGNEEVLKWEAALEKLANLSGVELKNYSCGFFPDDGMDRLRDKCLITIEGRYVRMHDLLQDMGREIVRLESPNEPGQRSRLFFHEDVRHVLEEGMGTNKVAGMIIEMPEGEEVIRLNSEAFVQMKRLRVLINRNASFSSGPNYLSNELRVLDWFEYPLQSLPPNFHGNKLIIFKMRGSFIRELSVIKFKNMTIMEFNDCNSLTKVPDLSSVQNLKELSVEMCTSLVEVHDSVGSLENLCELSFYGCSNLRIFPASLKLRSLRKLYLDDCSSLRSFPEIGCEMKSLTKLSLSCTAVEELPLSIGNLDRLDALFLHGCKNLKRLPINIILRLQHLTDLGIFGGCTNLVKKIGYDGQSILTIGSTRLVDEISSNEEQLQELVPPTNSSNGSSALQVLNRQNCFQSESNFFPISSFFTLFNSSATLTILNLSGSEFISVPTSIKGLVALEMLYLSYCEKLEEILELPPNITLVEAQGCKSLERFPEVSRIMEFNGSHIRSLGIIDLSRCDKMHEKILNYKVPNPLLWKAGHYNVTVLLENQISELGDEEFSEYEIVDKGDEEFSEDEIVNRGHSIWRI